MSHSRQPYDGDHPERFPQPMLWLVWVRDQKINYHSGIPNEQYRPGVDQDYKKTTYAYEITEELPTGKVRHKADLPECKKYLNGYARKHVFWEHGQPVFNKDAVWFADWKVFEFVEGEWVLRHEGYRGEARKDSPLWEREGRKAKVPTGSARKTAEDYALSVIADSLKAVG